MPARSRRSLVNGSGSQGRTASPIALDLRQFACARPLYEAAKNLAVSNRVHARIDFAERQYPFLGRLRRLPSIPTEYPLEPARLERCKAFARCHHGIPYTLNSQPMEKLPAVEKSVIAVGIPVEKNIPENWLAKPLVLAVDRNAAF